MSSTLRSGVFHESELVSTGRNIISGIQDECNRVRKILPHYEELGPVGTFGLAMLKGAIKEGELAIASGDVLRMVSAFKNLQECK